MESPSDIHHDPEDSSSLKKSGFSQEQGACPALRSAIRQSPRVGAEVATGRGATGKSTVVSTEIVERNLQ
jgi:hypothetical protein